MYDISLSPGLSGRSVQVQVQVYPHSSCFVSDLSSSFTLQGKLHLRSFVIRPSTGLVESPRHHVAHLHGPEQSPRSSSAPTHLQSRFEIEICDPSNIQGDSIGIHCDKHRQLPKDWREAPWFHRSRETARSRATLDRSPIDS